MAEQSPIIIFEKYLVTQYNYKRILENQEKSDKKQAKDVPIKTEVQSGTTANVKQGKIEITISYKKVPHDLKVTVVGFFKLNIQDYSKQQVLEALIVNGTAILYPYVRSVVSVLSSLSPEESIILPTVNTNNLLNSETSSNDSNKWNFTNFGKIRMFLNQGWSKVVHLDQFEFTKSE